MAKKISVAIICGGRSGEHEVSLRSAQSVINVLPKKFQPVIITIDKSGQWHLLSDITQIAHRAPPRIFLPNPNHKTPLSTLQGKPAEHIDVVFPLIHGTGGEDGSLQGLCELANIPYVGSNVIGSAIGMDKIIQKKLLKEAGFPIVPFKSFTATEWEESRGALLKKIIAWAKFPLFIKPVNMGSSVGISKVKNSTELPAAIAQALRYDTQVLIERGLVGVREIECAILGSTEHPQASMLGEIRSKNDFYDYAAKYTDGRADLMIPAPIPRVLTRRIQAMACRVFTTLSAYGIGRVDFFLQGTKVFVNEINTVPGFTSLSMYPMLWEKSGLSFSALLERCVELALARAKQQSTLSRSYTP